MLCTAFVDQQKMNDGGDEICCTRYRTYSKVEYTQCLSSLLMCDTISRSKSFGSKSSPFDSFYSLQPTEYRVSAYFYQFLEYLEIDTRDIVFAIILLDRYVYNVQMMINGKNWQLLAAAALLTAYELLNDEPHSPYDFKLVMYDYEEDDILNCYLELCKGLNWQLFVPSDQIESYLECRECLKCE